MRLTELKARISKAVDEGRFFDAFILKSLYIEAIITVLATSYRFHKKGYDGIKKSVAEAIESDPAAKVEYIDSMTDRLSANIKVLRGSNVITDKEVDALYTWKDKHRDHIFHNFAEILLHPSMADELGEKRLTFVKRFTESPWFKKMENNLEQVQDQVLEKQLHRDN